MLVPTLCVGMLARRSASPPDTYLKLYHKGEDAERPVRITTQSAVTSKNYMITPLYTVGGTVLPDEGIYIPRQADADLLNACFAHEYAYVLTARQMGKSSLMVRTAQRLEAEQTNAIIIDLNELGVQMTVEEWYLGLMFRIASRLDLQANLIAWWRDRSTMGVTQRLSLFFQEVVLPASDRPLVIFIDEIDTTLSLPFTDDFFAALRYLYNARSTEPTLRRLSFVLIGVATPSDLIDDPKRTPFNIGRRVDLTDFTLNEALPLAAGLPGGSEESASKISGRPTSPPNPLSSEERGLHLSRNQRISAEGERSGAPLGENAATPQQTKLLDRIIYWTGGHPYLTQRLCAAVAANGAQPNVDQTVASIFLGENSYKDNNLQFVRDMLTKRVPNGLERDVLATYERVRLARQRVRDEEQAPAKTHLKLSGIVKRQEDDLVVRNRIYEQVFDRRWIRNQWPVSWWQLIPAGVKWAAAVSVVLLAGLILATWFALQQQQQSQRLADDLAAEVVVRAAAEQQAVANADLAATRAAESSANADLAEDNAAQAEVNAAEAEENARLADERAREAEAANLLAQARALANESRLIGESEPQLALLLAVESLNLRDTLEGRLAIQQALENPGRRRAAIDVGNFLFSFSDNVWSPDGSRLLTIDADAGTATVWDGATGEPLQTVEHEGVASGEWHPDGERVITAGLADVRLWRADDGEVVASFDQPASIARLSHDQTRLAAFDLENEEVAIWDVASQERLQTLAVDEYAVRLRWHPDDTQLLVEGETNVLLFDVESGEQLHEFPPQIDEAPVPLSYSALWSEEGSRVLVHNPSLATGQGSVVVWDAASGELLLNLSEPPRFDADLIDDAATPVSAALWGKNGTILALTVDTRLLVWDGTTGELLDEQTLPVIGGGEIAEDGESLLLYNVSDAFEGSVAEGDVTPVGESALIVWNVEAGEERLRLVSSDTIQDFSWSQSGQRLATYDGAGGAVLWDLSPQGELANVLSGEVETVDWSADGRRYYAEGGAGEVAVFEGESGDVLSQRAVDGLIMQTGWHDDGEQLLVAPLAGPLTLFDVETDETTLSAPVDSLLLSAYFYNDSRGLFYNTIDGAIHFLDVPSGEELLTLPDVKALYTLTNKDETRAVTPGLDGRVAVWDLANPERPTHEFQHDRPVGLALFMGPDNQQLLTLSHVNYDLFGMAENGSPTQLDPARYREPTLVTLWSLTAPDEPLYQFELEGMLFGLDNEAGSKLLLYTSSQIPPDDVQPRIWLLDIESGEITFSAEQPSPISSGQWGDSADKFFTVGEDGRLRVWTLGADGLPTDEPVTLAVDGTRITAGDWAPNDASVLVGTADGRTLSLPLDLGVITERACANVYRNLTPVEWEQYLPGREYRETCELESGL